MEYVNNKLEEFKKYINAKRVAIIGLGVSNIPLINYLVAQITFLLNRPIFFSWSLVQAFTLGITAYCAIFALIGKYPRIYAISKLIDHNS